MKITKQFISFVSALVLTGSLVACGQPTANTPATTDPTEATGSLLDTGLSEAEKAILQERRDAAEAYMRESLSVLWRAGESLDYSLDASRDNGLKLHIVEGRIYQGVPYAYAVGTQDSFLEYAGEPDKDGVYTISGLEATALNYESYGGRVGNDCSGVLTNAWSQVGTSFDASRSCEMSSQHGVIPVGDYVFNPNVNETNGNITNTGVCTAQNGAQTMYNAYALLQKGDALFYVVDSGTNHSRMVVGVRVVYNGNVIDGTKSTVTVLEQTRSCFSRQSYYMHPELNEKVYQIGVIDQRYTFAELFNGGYLPVTIKEFCDPSPVDEPWVKDSVESPTKDNLFTGSITSNWYIDCVSITIADENGNTVQEVTGRARRRYNKNFQMERFVKENPGACLGSVDLTKLTSGHYKCTVTARLTTGEKIIARTFDFSV